MNKNYLTIALVFCLTFVGFAQNTVTVDASATQLGYANVFETEPMEEILLLEKLGVFQI